MVKLACRLLIVLTLCAVAPLRATGVESQVLWLNGVPHLEVTVKAGPQEGLKEILVPFTLYDAEDKPVWGTGLKVPAGPERPWKAQIALDKDVSNPQTPRPVTLDAQKQYRVNITLRHADLEMDYSEDIHFSSESGLIRSHGFRHQGVFPKRQVHLVLSLNAFRGHDLREIPVSIVLRDGEENTVLNRQTTIQPTNQPAVHLIDLTPDTSKSFGPFTAEVNIENDGYGIYFSASRRFGHANAMIPVSSMEHLDPELWFVSGGSPPNERSSLQLYYSPQLQALGPGPYPTLTYDTEQKHSGLQSLRIDYKAGNAAHVWGRQALPGKPVVLMLWVHGNGTEDTVVVTYEDYINHTLPAWHRNANFGQVTVCSLNFTDWRRFRVPVLGDGLQVTGIKGSTANIDAPIHVLALSVTPGRKLPEGVKPGDPLTFWVDDLGVETQVAPPEMLTLELKYSDPLGRVLPDGRLVAAVGNGLPEEIKKGKLILSAADRAGQPVFSQATDLVVPGEGYATAEFDLGGLAGKNPLGPVEVDVIFLDPAQPILRITRRVTLKNPNQGCLVWDFEEPVTYSSFLPGKVGPSLSQVKEGGAEGSKRSLVIPVNPKPDLTEEQKEQKRRGANVPDPVDNNSVLFHPSLPGMVDRIEMMVKGGHRSTVLQTWFADSGYTGIWLRPYNVFWPEPVTVDWQDWRKVVAHAPAIPPYHGDKNRYFLFKPWYPLNLAVNARLQEGTEPTEIRIDDVRVVTHIPASEEQSLELVYPDETRIHPPGSPLCIVTRNFAPSEKRLKLGYELSNFQGFVAHQGELDMALSPGAKQKFTLVDSLSPGIYDLRLRTAEEQENRAPILVLNARDYFGEDPLKFITDPVRLRQSLGLMTERVHLDWDNTEGVPYLYHYHWFNCEVAKRTSAGAYRAIPVVGFCADWAGPEAAESVRNATYRRWIPNILQAPVKLVDWSRFVRECAREYKDRFEEWVFWENPDLEDAPQSLGPENYAEMLRIFHQWVKLYRPDAKVIAGGFNFNKVLDYLDKVPNPYELRFDEFAVQMNIGELSPEGVDMEGFLDELNETLRIQETKRKIRTMELDWGIGEYVSPLQQAAYHARASMILNSRGAGMHQFSLINTGFALEGYGVSYRVLYGNSEEVRPGGTEGEAGTHLPFHVPKPSYFAIIKTRKFLQDWRYVQGVRLTGRSLNDNRAFVYRNDAGDLAVSLWRAVDGIRAYRMPPEWQGAQVQDVFGFPVDAGKGLPCTPLPFFIRMPAGYKPEQLVHDLRMMEAADGTFPVILDLHLSEPDSVRRAQYQNKGQISQVVHGGTIPGGLKVRETHLQGLEAESFGLSLEKPGHVLLRRRWHFAGDGQKLYLKLNDGQEQAWDLTKGQGNEPGVRESTFVLANCRAGENRVAIRYEQPGNCAGYRLESMPEDHVPLVRWGVLNTRQSKGQISHYTSAVGTALKIGKTAYENGTGAHAVSFMEYPLDGLFGSLEVTVGIDGSTEGRGSVVFRVFVDDKERVDSGLMTGFSPPKTLKVEELAGARRMILSVLDAGDGDRNDLANWVDGKLYLKKE